MPEYIVGIALTSLLGALGFLNRRIDMVNSRLEAHELKVAENYVTKAEVSQNFERLFEMLIRLRTRWTLMSLKNHTKSTKSRESTISDCISWLLKTSQSSGGLFVGYVTQLTIEQI